MSDIARVSGADLLNAIRARYTLPEWHCEQEVTLCGRRIDVVALNMWGARGFRIVGFEIKLSRGDWMRELGAFQKAEEWTSVCDQFYVVTPPKLVRPDELPDGWGHLELCGSRMFARRHAPLREGRTTIPREVAARFITRLAQEIESRNNNARWEIDRAVAKRVDKEVAERLEERTSELRQTAEKYHVMLRTMGIIDFRPEEQVVKLVRLLAALRADRTLVDRIERLVRELDEVTPQLREVVMELAA